MDYKINKLLNRILSLKETDLINRIKLITTSLSKHYYQIININQITILRNLKLSINNISIVNILKSKILLLYI